MKRLLDLLYSEPVVILSAVTAVTAVLSQQHLVPTWVPLVVLAIVTPIQRQLVTPGSKLKKLGTVVRRELGL